MFETYGAAWREAKRWWRDAPVGAKILTPIVLIVGAFLPDELSGLAHLFDNSDTSDGSRDPRAPKDFGPPDSGDLS